MIPACHDIDALERICNAFVDESVLNRVASKAAIRPDLAGFVMYEHPLVGVASASDPLFAVLRRPEVAGPVFRPPSEWLPEAKSVISFFLPFTDPVVESNRADPKWPSDEWLHARLEGEMFVRGLSARLTEILVANGHAAVAPGLHPDFAVHQTEPGKTPEESGSMYPISNWSERHVGHVAGLGTFGLSSAFITRRGAAGRMGSVVTDLELPPTPRPYRAHDEYCSHCGACVRACGVSAISAEKGRKDKRICSARLDAIASKYSPRYGCGKCYVKVPCARRAPGRPGERG